MGPKDSLPHSQVAEYCVTLDRIVKSDTICPATLLRDPITLILTWLMVLPYPAAHFCGMVLPAA
jgi:hypothetical protein